MKRLITFILLLLCVTANAQEIPIGKDQIYSIDNFSKMQKSQISPFLIPKGSADKAFNVRANEQYGSLSKRKTYYKVGSCHNSAVKSLYRYYKSDATKYTIDTTSTYIDYIDEDGTCTTLYSNASDGKRWSFVTYKDLLIGMNGTDNAKIWDGSTGTTADTDGMRTANDLVSDLGAPFAELDTGTDLDASSWYQYKIAYYDGSTYSYSDARSNPLLTGSSVHNIALTDIPLGPSGTTQRIIYRTVGDASRTAVTADTSFYRVATISDNTTTTYSDSSSDATILADTAPTWATVSAGTPVTPPKSKYSLIHKERLFIANDPSGTAYGKSTIYWSKALIPSYFDYNTDYELIRPDDGDEITFMKNLLGILTVGKTTTISKIYTSISNSVMTVTPSAPFSFIGCVAPWSAVNGITGVIYLGRYGLYSFGGQNSELISDVVTDKIKDIKETNLDDVVGAFYDNSYYLAYTSSDSGASSNNRVLIYDMIRDSYVEDTTEFDSFSVFNGGDDSGLLYAGSSANDGKVWSYTTGSGYVKYRYKSEFDGGTASSVYVGGTENDPTVTLGSSDTWADEGTETWAGSGSKTWMIESLTGTWISPAIEINAVALDEIKWNEVLGDYGDITVAIKTASTSGGLAAASWSSEYTDPTGSDISGETANNYIQIRISLSSTVYTESPTLFLDDSFVLSLSYSKSGTNKETAYLSLWRSGFTKMGSDYPKRIKEIQVYYEGTSGTLTLEFENSENESYSFSIDLSVDPTSNTSDSYFGTNENKIYVYVPAFNVSTNGRQFRYKFSETGTEQWKVNRVVVRYDTNPYITFGSGL